MFWEIRIDLTYCRPEATVDADNEETGAELKVDANTIIAIYRIRDRCELKTGPNIRFLFDWPLFNLCSNRVEWQRTVWLKIVAPG